MRYNHNVSVDYKRVWIIYEVFMELKYYRLLSVS